MFSPRLRCHFCGTRSSHPKNVREFTCTTCEAFNFFDGKGNVVDTPTAVSSQPTQSRHNIGSQIASPAPPSETMAHQQSSVFCRICVQNQLLYTQALANYLPDEDHPRYREIEAALPQYQAQLERRYPQVCKKCAPLAQSNINRADYYSKTQLISKLAFARKARGGKPLARTRDSPKKKLIRLSLNLVRVSALVALLGQVAFHLYGVLFNLRPASYHHEIERPDTPSQSPLCSCAREALSMSPNSSCFTLFSSLIPYTIILSMLLLWYNPGMNAWFHHTVRIEAVEGQQRYFWVHVLIIAIRCVAWYSLSDPSTVANFDRRQLAALHISAVIFMGIFHVISTYAIKPVAWKMRGSIMPRPEDREVLGLLAGPEQEAYTPKASEKDPWRYLRKQSKGQFDINSLAPHTATLPSKARNQWPEAQFPSPEDTEESDMDDGDAMETDFKPVMRSSFKAQAQAPSSHLHNQVGYPASQPQGWSEMRGEIYSMQDQMRMERERKSQEQSAQHTSPFRGKLPLAPMSMERRLRNPIIQTTERAKVPLSQQKNFFSQMSTGIRPVALPEKGSNMELRKSTWTLQSDVRETGLEDLLGGNSFRIDDEPSPGRDAKTIGWFSTWVGRNR